MPSTDIDKLRAEVHKMLDDFVQPGTTRYMLDLEDQIVEQFEAYKDAAVKEARIQIADWLQYEGDVFNGFCNKCGGIIVECRAQYPGGKARLLCPTCLDDIRLDVISNLTSEPGTEATLTTEEAGS